MQGWRWLAVCWLVICWLIAAEASIPGWFLMASPTWLRRCRAAPKPSAYTWNQSRAGVLPPMTPSLSNGLPSSRRMCSIQKREVIWSTRSQTHHAASGLMPSKLVWQQQQRGAIDLTGQWLRTVHLSRVTDNRLKCCELPWDYHIVISSEGKLKIFSSRQVSTISNSIF